MRTHNEDLRQRIVAAREKGHSSAELARLFGVSKRSVERFWKQHQATGSVKPKQRGGYRRSRLVAHDAVLRAWIAAQADLTLSELQVRLQKELGITLGITALWHRLERLGLSYKKTLSAAEQERADIKVARAEWHLQRVHWSPERLIFLDETGLNTKMTRLYGRAAGGARCACQVPHGHWQTATFIAGLRCDRMSAPMLVDGPMDGPIFLAYVEQFLAPELVAGDIVVCDNLSCHKVKGVREAIAARGARLEYLPAYSPDLNPIEMAYSKLKATLRQSARRTFDGLARAVTSALDGFSSTICHNFFRHAGYATD